MVSVSLVLPCLHPVTDVRSRLDALALTPEERAEVEVVLVGPQAAPVESPVAAWNAGAATARGDYLVCLDEATRPTPGWLAALRETLAAEPDAVAVGSLLLYPDDTIRQAGYVVGQDGRPRPLYPGLPARHPAVARPRSLQAVAGVGLLVRRAAFLDAGGFDLDLGQWADVDLCLRLAERGTVHLCPASRLYHLAPEPADADPAAFAALRERWADRLRPDDLAVYQADGLLGVEYPVGYPLRLRLSPRLVTLGGDPAPLAEGWLTTQVAQVADRMRQRLGTGPSPLAPYPPDRLQPPEGSATFGRFAEGSATVERVSSGDPPFPYPPPDLVFRVVGAAGLDWFLQSGRMTEEDFRLALADVGLSYADFSAVYDFGCGSGRVLRWLRAAAPHAALYGSDVDISAVAWLRRSLPGVDVRVNNALPPLPFRDGLFDLVLGFSVLTHLDAAYQDAWLAELRRVTLPGATLLLTVHGEKAWREFRRTTLAQVAEVAALEAQLRREGFLFWRGDGWERHFPDYYHSSWHLPDYIHRHWSRWFTVLRVREGGARTIQDMVVLRREA